MKPTDVIGLLLGSFISSASGFVATPTARRPLGNPGSVNSCFHPRAVLQPLLTLASEESEGILRNDVPPAAAHSIETATAAPEDEDLTAQVPDTNKILSIAIPAIGIWLCSPLLSMIDTCSVGLLSGTIQQAALNPAVAVTEYSSRLLYFLFTGTTNLVALSQKEDEGVQGMPNTANVFSNSMQLAVFTGIGLGVALLGSSGLLLRLLIGNDGLDPSILSAAGKYVGIRALGMPAAAMIGTAQAACLGLQDAKSAFRVFGVAAIVNLIVDLILVRQPHPWIGGVAGAAWATVLAQYFAAWLFVKWLCTKGATATAMESKGAKNRLLQRFSQSRAQPDNLQRDKEQPSTRGFLAGRFGFRELLRRPEREISKGFVPFVLPVTITQVGRCSPYAAMGHVVSSSFGTISMAANQIVLSIFTTLIPIADSLSLTAQSLIPGIIAGKKGGNDKQQEQQYTTMPPKVRPSKILWKTSVNFMKAAVVMGMVQASIVACIPFAGRFFTTDPAVIQMVNSVVPILLALFASHGVFCAAEGILVGQGDIKWLGRIYGVFCAVIPFLMLRVKWAVAAGNTAVNLLSVWKVFLGYQIFRISAFLARGAWLQWKLYDSERGGTGNEMDVAPVGAS